MPERGEALQPLTLKSSFWPEEYPMTWARLVNGGAAKGDVQLQLDLDDLPPAPRGEMWGPGDKILITARTQVRVRGCRDKGTRFVLLYDQFRIIVRTQVRLRKGASARWSSATQWRGGSMHHEQKCLSPTRGTASL
jgi:hypothetical protein